MIRWGRHDVELELVRHQRDALVAVVRVYEALGGGWQG